MKKRIKLISMILALAAMAALTMTPALADYDGAVTAAPTASKILVNGKTTAFTAYTINQSNYFKLRDIAMTFNGTAKTFSVDWDGSLNEIDLITGDAYKPIGGEMAAPKSMAGVTAIPSSSSILINGWESVVMAYTIGDNNFFRLRDLAAVLNFGLTWNGKTNTISIDTTVGYDSSDNSIAGGPRAELIGAWSGNFPDGKWGTCYFYWDGSYEEGYGDPANGDYHPYNTGSFQLFEDTVTLTTSSGSVTYSYTLSRMDDSVALDLTNRVHSITLFKH